MAGREIFANSDEGRVLRVVADSVRVLATGEDTGGAYEVFVLSGLKDSDTTLHAHPWGEAYLMLEGEVEMTIGENRMIATPGCFINVPGGALHAYKILSERARFVLITTPTGAHDFFSELDRETAGAPENLEKVVQIALQHGFMLPSPPPAA